MKIRSGYEKGKSSGGNIQSKAINSKSEIENSTLPKDTKKLEVKKEKSRKPKKPFTKLTPKSYVGMSLVGVSTCILLSSLTCGLYYNWVRYPKMENRDTSNSGLDCLNKWVSDVNSNNLSKDSYLYKETLYANNNKDRLAFIDKVLGTVSYSPNKVRAKNIYGNDMKERGTDEQVYVDSLVNTEGEEVLISYIDYSQIPLDEDIISSMVKEEGLNVGVGDYSTDLIDVFCRYICSLEEVPLLYYYREPKMSNGTMLEDEDIYLDKELFSSESFHKLLTRFSEVASKSMVNPDWYSWKENGSKGKEPSKKYSGIKPLKAWLDWDNLSFEQKLSVTEPIKYKSTDVISNTWCGSYYLLKEYKTLDSNGNAKVSTISAEIGDGTLENPAGLNTGVVTYILVNEGGKRVPKPIKVKLVDFKVSQKAIDYFESMEDRNRGFDIKSEVQYASYTFEITNLSLSELTVYDDSGLCDKLANVSPRTGTIFGLRDSLVLKPYESGRLETWGCSTELNKKYLIWGADFNKSYPNVWFRVLQGDIDDPSEEKGVTINDRFKDNDN